MSTSKKLALVSILMCAMLSSPSLVAGVEIKKDAPQFRGVRGFAFKKGWFVSGDVGIFTAIGGFREGANANQRLPRSFSSIQPFIGISVGYDVFEFLALALQLGQGYVAGAARISNDIESPTDYALTFIDAAVIGSLSIYDRLRLSGSIMGGFVMMTPSVQRDAQGFGGNVGARIGFHYDTLLSGVVVGVNVNGNLSFLPRTGVPGIVSLSLTPVISYVF